jgi:hypothetical protein
MMMMGSSSSSRKQLLTMQHCDREAGWIDKQGR